MQEKQFTAEGLKSIEKMAKIGSDNASVALSKLIDQAVRVEALRVQSIMAEKIAETIGDPEETVTTVVMMLSGDVKGQIILVYPQMSALNIADFLAKRPLGSTSNLDELDKSAIKESGNIVAGSFLSALTDYLDLNMIESVPDLAVDMLKATVDSSIARFVGEQAAEAIAMEINFGMGAGADTAEKVVPEIKIKGHFVLLLDNESAKKVIASLKDISGGKKMTKGGGRRRQINVE